MFEFRVFVLSSGLGSGVGACFFSRGRSCGVCLAGGEAGEWRGRDDDENSFNISRYGGGVPSKALASSSPPHPTYGKQDPTSQNFYFVVSRRRSCNNGRKEEQNGWRLFLGRVVCDYEVEETREA